MRTAIPRCAPAPAGPLPALPAALLAALIVGLLPSGASAEEYKLVLAPEAGQAPPARVCLVSRNARMKVDRASGAVAGLASRVKCADGVCAARRDTRPARCQDCPDTSHPGCASVLDLGERTVDDYSVVCADDDTSPREGGTVYISVESVEAENAPRFYSFEVSGGRVRWSPFEPISRPSYRVLGGDFDPSRFSYPRVPSEQPWAEVPLRRRCRCLDARVGPGIGAIEAVRIDEAPVCRGAVSGDGLLPVEVPAVGLDRVSALDIRAAHADMRTRWSSRWPTVPIEVLPARFTFDWTMPCMWPRADVCPTVVIRGAQCTSAPPTEGKCRYACRVIADSAVSPPLQMHLHLDDPAMDLTEILGAVGQTIVGRVPADARVVWTDVSSWERHVPGDRIRAIEVLGVDGTRLTIELSAQDSDRITVPLPGVRCGTSLRTELIGERDFEAGYGVVTRGAHLQLPEPEALGVPWDMLFGAGGGAAMIFAVEPGAGSVTSSSLSYVLDVTLGVRLRPQGSSWFLEPQLIGLYMAGWPYNPLSAVEGVSATAQHHYFAVAGELALGRTLLFGGRTFHLLAGGGVGIGFDPFIGDDELVEQGREMGLATLGMATPFSQELDTPFGIRFDLRYWFGSRTLHYSIDESIAIVRTAQPAHALMLSATIFAKP